MEERNGRERRDHETTQNTQSDNAIALVALRGGSTAPLRLLHKALLRVIDGDHHSVTTHSKSECVPRTFLVVDIVEQGSSGSLSEEPCNVLDIFRKQ